MSAHSRPRPPENYGDAADKALPYGLSREQYLEIAMAALDQAGLTTIELHVVVSSLPLDAEQYVLSIPWLAKDVGVLR
jgi:hypothetical protein